MNPKRQPIYHADCIEIPLTKGRSAFVDLDCPPEILARNWCACSYVQRGVYCGRLQTTAYLHREILGLGPDCDLKVDHIDGDRLNNRRSNLRACTQAQNCANRSANPSSGSKFRGVHWSRQAGMWCAKLNWRIGGKKYAEHVGYFDDEIEAARAWDETAAASGHYDPKYLRLNFPDQRQHDRY